MSVWRRIAVMVAITAAIIAFAMAVATSDPITGAVALVNLLIVHRLTR